MTLPILDSPNFLYKLIRAYFAEQSDFTHTHTYTHLAVLRRDWYENLRKPCPSKNKKNYFNPEFREPLTHDP